MSELWLPGVSGPHEELVGRIVRAIERFAAEAKVERAYVEVELADGARHVLDRLEPDPGFGFVTIVPYRQDDDEPERLIVPVGSIRRIELSRAEERRAELGFSAPLAPT